MSNSIDNRVVNMKFDNSQFQSRIQSTLDALKKLGDGLKLKGAGKGLSEASNAVSKFSLAGIAKGVDQISSKFTALGVLGVATLANIANKAINAGLDLAKSFTIQPIIDGFNEYELKMGSIQTIMANTARHGTGLDEVNAALDELNEYADLTIYNFGEMTRNVGLFTNAGIKIEDATAMIKGFSNVAAASGTSSSGAAAAAYQLSQALSTGTIRLMDWRSLTNVGMGNKNMQDGLIEIASAMGQFNDSTTTAKAASDDFNGSLETNWLSADVMSSYLRIMAGEMSDAEMAAMGLSKAQIKAFKESAATAQDAATKVRTFTQLMGTLKEGVGSGWAETFGILLGDFDEATELFSGIYNKLGPMIDRYSDARNKLLQGWKDMGGRDLLLKGFQNLFDALGNIISPIQKAFRDIFPPMTAQTLYNLTAGFEKFTRALKMGGESSNGIRQIFKGLFSIIKVLLIVVINLGKYFLDFARILLGLAGGVIAMVGVVGLLVQRLGDWVAQSKLIQKFFDMIIEARAAVLDPLVKTINLIAEGFAALASGDRTKFFEKIRQSAEPLNELFDVLREKFDLIMDGLSRAGSAAAGWLSGLGISALTPIINGFEKLSERLDNLRSKFKEKFSFKFSFGNFGRGEAQGEKMIGIADRIKSAWEGVKDIFSKIGDFLAPILSKIGSGLGAMKDKFAEAIDGMGVYDFVAMINTGFFIAMYAMIRSFTKEVKGLVGEASEAIGSIGETFGALTGYLKTMQQDVKSNIILKIAIAIGVLAGALWVISKIPADDLKKAILGLGALIAELSLAMLAMSSIPVVNGGKMLVTAASMILLSLAVAKLAEAATIMAGLDWKGLAKGLVATGALLAGLALFTKFSEANKGGIAQGVGLILLAVAIKMLATAVEKFGEMDVNTLLKGVGAVTVLIGALSGMAAVLGQSKGVLSGSVGILILAAALSALYLVVRLYETMEWETLLVGLGKLALVLVALGLALHAFPTDTPQLAAGLLLLSGAMSVLYLVMLGMSQLSWEDLAKGLVGIGGAIAILAIGLNLMNTTQPGVLALLGAALALAVLTPVLMTLSTLSWEALLVGLTALAGVFVILGLAGLVLTPVLPSLAILAGIILALGVAMALTGVGMLAFGVGFGLLVAAIAAGVTLLMGSVQVVLAALPLMAQQIGLAIIAFARAIQMALPSVIAMMTDVVRGIIQVVTANIPAFMRMLEVFVISGVNTIRRLIPQIAAAGLDMIIELLEAVDSRIDEIMDLATDIIVKFIDGITRNLPKIIESGKNLILKFVNGVADAIRNNQSQMDTAGRNLAGAVVSGMTSGISAGIESIKNAAINVARSALDAAKSFLGIKSPSREFMKVGRFSSEGMAIGIEKYGSTVERSSEKVGMAAINAMKKTIGNIPNITGDMDLNPTIRPVLDLSEVRKDARELEPILAGPPVTPRTTRAQALAVQETYSSRRDEPNVEAPKEVRNEFYFEQNNNSPKALSAAEIYRQTKNQLSVIKGVIE